MNVKDFAIAITKVELIGLGNSMDAKRASASICAGSTKIPIQGPNKGTLG